MRNPFYLKPLPIEVPFCNREKEIKDLMTHAINSTNVVLISPRRYGKTSLVRRVQDKLAKKGFLTLYLDFFGVTSITEVASKFARGIYSTIYKNESLFKKAVKLFLNLRPVIKPDPETGISVTIEVSKSKTGTQLLEEAMSGFDVFLKSNKLLCNIALDEFQEIAELDESMQIEGIMRAHIQLQQNVSYYFVGSRRRILSDMFNDRNRPFYKSAINYPLDPLPMTETIGFLISIFKKNGKSCPENTARGIYEITQGYPYYIQKLSYYIYESAQNAAGDNALHQGIKQLLNEETSVFEMMLQNLRPRQSSFLFALSKEPTKTPFTADYLKKHNLGSIGGIQAATKKLVTLDYIEKAASTWRVVDPIFSLWLRKREIIE